MYFGAFQKGQTNINSVLKSLISIHENRKYLKQIFDFLDIEKKILDPKQPQSIPETIEHLALENVTFQYPGTSKKIIKNISFSIKKGQILAIVGMNGSGKSTIVKLLTDFTK